MNKIWTLCVTTAVVCLCIVSPEKVLPVCTNSCTSALTTCANLVAVYAVWLGLFKIGENAGLVEWLATKCQKVIRFLYGNVDGKSSRLIALNNASNLLGIGNAATPSGVKAMGTLERGEKLSRSGAMLFVLNATSLQLLPTTVLGMRASSGSTAVSSTVLPTLIVTILTTVMGILLVNLSYGRAK